MTDVTRCPIPRDDAFFQAYHDNEWGVPVTDDRLLFEKICLEGFQSGLSWRTILHRRKAFRDAFDGFDAARVAMYTAADVEKLASNAGIIRNRRKIHSAINNARRVEALTAEFGSLSRFIWSFEPSPEQRPHCITRQWLQDNPHTAESSALSAALKKRGWSFVGPTNMYALMQAMGIVNDHVHGCERQVAIENLRASTVRP